MSNDKKQEFHRVLIFDEDAKALIDQFLPPDGTAISAEELEERCRRLAEAARALKRAEGNEVKS
jgi:hypothetical protein